MMQLEVAGLGALLASEHVTGVTRAALEARLMEAEHPPRFLAAAEFATLAGVCKRLLPQDNVGRRPIASLIDTRLADGRTDGWRYAELPNDGEAFRAGLAAIDVAAGGNFVTLNSEMQDAVLSTIQQSHPLFFKDLLAEVVERHYADPRVQAAIGCVGFADRPAWAAIGLDEREAREPA